MRLRLWWARNRLNVREHQSPLSCPGAREVDVLAEPIPEMPVTGEPPISVW